MKTISDIAMAMDHGPLRESLADLLTTLGYNVIARVPNGRELITALEKMTSPKGICIVDVRISSKIDGPAICKELKKRFPNIKVIGYSMTGDPKMVEKMMQNGADRFVPKGSDIEVLLSAVEELSITAAQ